MMPNVILADFDAVAIEDAKLDVLDLVRADGEGMIEREIQPTIEELAAEQAFGLVYDLKPECTCNQVDDSSDCEFHNPLSEWNRWRRRVHSDQLQGAPEGGQLMLAIGTTGDDLFSCGGLR